MFPLRLFSGLIILALCAARQYIFVNENKTWTEAQSYCRDKYTDLVTIANEQESTQLLNTVNDYNSIDLAWIGLYDDLNDWKWTLEDSDFFQEGEKLFRNWHNPGPGNYAGQGLCVYMQNGIWSTTKCSDMLGFICYDGRENASSRYILIGQPKNWTEAQRYCREHHTDLVSIRNETENQQIQPLDQNYYTIWIGLYRTRSWSDQSNSTFSNWKTGEPNGVGYCTVVSFSDNGTWTDENCNQSLPFLCYSALASSRQYHFVFEYKSWSDAQRYCRENYTDLATIDNMDEMNSLMNTVNGTYSGSAWIGLYDDLNSWRWSLEDKVFYKEEERDFRNWYHEPDNNRGNELCVYMDVTLGTWFDSSCNNTLSFVCYDGRENATQRYIKITEAKIWTEARRYCREQHTDLVNVRNMTENQRLLNHTGGLIWIGLYRNRIWSDHQISSYQNWRPGIKKNVVVSKRAITPLIEDTQKNSFQYCTAVSIRQLAQWTNMNCLFAMPFFCYRSICTQSSCSPRQYHFINESKSWSDAQRYCREIYTDLATIDNMKEMNSLIKTIHGMYYDTAWIGQYDDMKSWRWSLGNTELEGGFKSWNVQQPKNWYGQSFCVIMQYQGMWQETSCTTSAPFICYDGRQNANVSYVYVNENKNWTEAQRYCREHHTDLVSIRNETENQQIRTLDQSFEDVWIGLYRTRSWSDQSNSTFSNWGTGEPNNAGNAEYCTAVSFSDSGKWADKNCYYQLPFLCYSGKVSEDSMLEKYNRSLASSRQYHFISVNKSWSDAQRYCRENYTDLATIDNMDEMISLMNTVNDTYSGSAWIGLYDDLNTWRWSMEDTVFYREGERDFRNWYHEPDNNRGNELCVYMDVTVGTWFDVSCDSSFTFVCYDGRENASQKYVMIYQKKTWSDAQKHCRELYTDLASVRNETERKQILSSTRPIEITEGLNEEKLWIGLHRSKLWSDQSNSTFIYSLSRAQLGGSQPDNGASVTGQAGTQHCTALSPKYFGYWSDEQCFERLPFFCYNDKYVFGLRVKFSSKDNMTESQIVELIDKLKQEMIRQGLPDNFTMRLRNHNHTMKETDSFSVSHLT